MKPDEAATLGDFLKAAFPSLTDEQVDVYREGLLFEDAELASKAILAGVREWKFPPRFADIVERIRMERRATMASIPATVEKAIEDLSIPLWVKRWIYARFILDPPDRRVFQQQFPDIHRRGQQPEEGWMPADLYADKAAMISDLFVRQQVIRVTGGGSTEDLSRILRET